MSTRDNSSTSNFSNNAYKKGDEIEVLRNADADDVPVWFPATVIDSPSTSGTVRVKFTTLYMERDGKERTRKRKKIRENIDLSDGITRPVPPVQPHRCFVVGDEVEVFHEKGWRRGKVKEVLEHLKYSVVVGDAVEVVVENCMVRAFLDLKQNDGSFVPSNRGPQQEKSPKLHLQSKTGTKLRIICSPRTLKTNTFHKGMEVEVRSNEEGYHGAWFTAKVVGSVGEGKLLVQYDTLTTDDEMQPLVELAYASNVRPLPPIINRIDRFKMLEKVDAWYNDGWWVGLVSKVVGLKYVVYFWTTNEELEFEHTKLRPHQDLVKEKWVASFLRPKLAAKPRLEKVKIQSGRTLLAGLLLGLKVEIAHGENGYLSSWYPAVILGPASGGKYMVEYRSLKTNNGRELVKEKVDVSCIRPCPPIIQQTKQFQLGDAVDAWDVDGWRIGQICRSMEESKYAVYIWATSSVIEHEHADLRPHQDLVDGAWIVASGIPK